MPLPPDYEQRVYAGVLGKIIGVYLGRPIEGWSHDAIAAEFGEIDRYVHDRRGVPLVVTDDDISGTFTFLRALPDNGNTPDLTPKQIGDAWLNYLIEDRTVLWWGGMGNSTEHTAYLRLKHGIPAPQSGSAARNGKVVSEQIGAQIFIDGWAMVAPGDPERAADLARRAASVSHDGEAVHAASVIAAMESLAFVEPRLDRLIDAATGLIPKDSLIARLIADVRAWHAADKDWRRTRGRIDERYGYHRYGGNCHVVPNHALIHLALLYGEDDFGRSLMIVNTCGWDTDCNSGNVGCLLGIKLGLAGIGPRWRDPVGDRLYLSTADGGRAITDALTEAHRVVDAGRALSREPKARPKDGARFHFSGPGATHGFQAEGPLTLDNTDGRLALHYRLDAGGAARASTPTFIPPEALNLGGYALFASPTLYSGQVVSAAIMAAPDSPAPVRCRLLARHYGAADELIPLSGPEAPLSPGERRELQWRVPDTVGAPIAAVGLEVRAAAPAAGTLFVDFLTWDGTPTVTWGRPAGGGTLWRRAWVAALDQFRPTSAPYVYRVVQNEGTGLAIQGTREWTDYRVEAAVAPHMAASAGVAVRVQGLRRYYALLLTAGDRLRLVKALDGTVSVLAEAPFPWRYDEAHNLSLAAEGQRLRGAADGRDYFDVADQDRPLTGGAVALVCEEGRIDVGPVRVEPVT